MYRNISINYLNYKYLKTNILTIINIEFIYVLRSDIIQTSLNSVKVTNGNTENNLLFISKLNFNYFNY